MGTKHSVAAATSWRQRTQCSRKGAFDGAAASSRAPKSVWQRGKASSPRRSGAALPQTHRAQSRAQCRNFQDSTCATSSGARVASALRTFSASWRTATKAVR